MNEDIFNINRELKNFESSNDSVVIVEHPQFITPSNKINDSLLAADGLHLSFEGTRVLVENIESAIIEVKHTMFENQAWRKNHQHDSSEDHSLTLKNERLTYSDVVKFGEEKKQDSSFDVSVSKSMDECSCLFF